LRGAVMSRYLIGRNRKREVAEQNALQDRIAFRFERTMNRQLSRAMRAALRQYESDKSDFGVESTIAAFNNQLGAAMANDWRTAMETFGRRVLDANNKSRLFEKKDFGDEEDYFQTALQNYIRTWQGDKVKDISQTTIRQMRQMIADAELEGLSVNEVAKQISEKIPSISRVRARTIARTETHTAANIGQQAAAEATGLNLLKEWTAFIDGREREAHAEADGQVVGLNESFTVGGEELDLPGDPSGSPENIINCRCVVRYLEA
jgi:uncharacterized protein with gpF-like domain